MWPIIFFSHPAGLFGEFTGKDAKYMEVNILAVGDVVGEGGIDFLTLKLRGIKKFKNISFTVVNGENAAMKGITPAQADAVFSAGADVITLGNHAFGQNALFDYLDDCRYILRPENFAPQAPGVGCGVFDTSFGPVLVANLIGRCGMTFGPDNPFHAADRILRAYDGKIALFDFHAEATSEKLAMSYYLDGRVSALWGTHTHVQTSDSRVMSGGLGYISDIGMTGPAESVLGIAPGQSVSMFLGNPPQRYRAAEGQCKMECAVFSIDTVTGRCASVEALRIM